MRDYRNIFNKVVPYHTDDSLSLYEFVGKLYEWLKDFEGSLDEAHGKIDEFITQFSTDLNETTKKILTEWHDDGTLAELINLVWAEKADKTYVDNLVSQTANGLTDNYTQADSNLRDQVNANVSAVETTLDNKITGVESSLNTKITGVETTANAVYFHYISDSVLEYARTITDTNFKVIRCSAPTDVPSDYQYSNGFVLRRGEVGINVVLFSYTDPTKMVSNVYYGSEWSGWREIGDQTPTGALANGTDLHTLEVGRYSLGGATGSYVNGLAGMYGILEVKSSGAYKLLTFHNVNNTFWIKTYNRTTWSEWKEITGA